MAAPQIPRDDLIAAAGARRELGAELEPAVVDAFIERVERAIDARVEQRLAEREAAERRPPSDGATVKLALGSLALAIPIMGAAESTLTIIVAWIAIVAINVAHALGGRRR
jgi:hypothetical protein